MSELVSNGVQIYQFPTDDEAVAEINSVMNVSNAAKCIASRSCDKLNCCAKIHLKGKFRWVCPDAKYVWKLCCGSDRCLRLLHTKLIKMWLLFNLCGLSGDTQLNPKICFIGFWKNTFFKIHFYLLLGYLSFEEGETLNKKFTVRFTLSLPLREAKQRENNLKQRRKIMWLYFALFKIKKSISDAVEM